MRFKTGLLRAPEPPRLKFAEYLLPEALPAIPPTFGHQGVYLDRGWGMLGNDKLGDCTVAGAMHAIMLWRALAGDRVIFTTPDATEDYFAITGGEDSGVDMVQQAQYWQKVGFRDWRADRHKILAYVSVDPANIAHVDAACYLFDAVGLGISVGEEEERAFVNRQPWLNPNSPAAGYHYVPMIGKGLAYREIITWGGDQDVGEDWFRAKVSEVVAVLTDENLVNGKTKEGFDLAALQADLQQLTG